MIAADGEIDPLTAATPEQYLALLDRLRRQSGLSYRILARRAAATGRVLPPSTLATALHRSTLPRSEVVVAFLVACDVPGERQAAWLTQLRRLAGTADASRLRSSPVPRQLPAPPRLFAGRVRELASLARALEPRSTAVLAITGTGGVGKTWLALRWAHDHLDHYPDGQLYVDLHGFDPSGRPTRPDEAVRALLSALGVAPAALPAGLDAQAGLYRSLVAGQRLLIVLDNARDADQVRPLLPGTASCTVIITSRRRLTSLVATEGAGLVPLDLLAPTDAYRLLALRLGEGRLAAEPAATADIIARCAGLPLALALVSARAANCPQWTLAELGAELSDPDPHAGVGEDVNRVFSSSYESLSPAAARLFRLLGLHPGPDIGVPAAAALAGTPAHLVRPLLAELAAAHLTGEHHPGRYSLHDLLRAYAAERALALDDLDDRHAAVARTFDHYLRTASAAGLLLAPHREPITLGRPGVGEPEPLTDAGQALAWFAREHSVLVAVVHWAAGGFESYAWRLADAMGGYFARQGHWHDWEAIGRAALEAASRAGDRHGQARAHCWLAEAYAWIGRPDESVTHLVQAGHIYERLRHTTGQAYVHLCWGWVYEPRRQYDEALNHSEQALRLYTAAGHRTGQANARNNIGWYHAQLGNYAEAIAHGQRALTEHQELGNRSWEGRTWDSLGYSYHQLGAFDRAIECFGQAIRLFRDLGSRLYEARALQRLGDAYHSAGQTACARTAWQRALDVFEQLQHPQAGGVRLNIACLERSRTNPNGRGR